MGGASRPPCRQSRHQRRRLLPPGGMAGGTPAPLKISEILGNILTRSVRERGLIGPSRDLPQRPYTRHVRQVVRAPSGRCFPCSAPRPSGRRHGHPGTGTGAGMLRTPKRAAVACASSMLSLSSRTSVRAIPAARSNSGVIVRHGPHQGAHISTSTGMSVAPQMFGKAGFVDRCRRSAKELLVAGARIWPWPPDGPPARD